MATDGDTAKDLKAHQGTYAAFTGMMKWGAIGAMIVGAIVIWIIHA